MLARPSSDPILWCFALTLVLFSLSPFATKVERLNNLEKQVTSFCHGDHFWLDVYVCRYTNLAFYFSSVFQELLLVDAGRCKSSC